MANIVKVTDDQKKLMTQVTGTLFSDIDFDGLNNIIDNIGNIQTEISDEQRKQAASYIDSWEQIVQRRLNEKNSQMHNLLRVMESVVNIFQIKAYYGYSDYLNAQDEEHAFQAFLSAAKTLSQNEKTLSSVAVLESLEEDLADYQTFMEDEKPQKEMLDPNNSTANQLMNAQLKFAAADAKYQQALSKKEFAIRKKYTLALRAIMSDKAMKEFKKATSTEQRKYGDACTVAQEKAALAKMNILIPDTDLRKVLQDLSSWQKSL